MRLTTLLLLLLLAFPVTAESYRVGVAQVDITPEHPVRLNGFGFRRTESEGAYQRIWAKAMAIEDSSGVPTLLVTVDILGIPDDVRAELAKRLAKDLPASHLTLTATHTHTGPMITGANPTIFGTPIPKEHYANIDRYTKVFLDKLEKVCREALSKRQAATLSWGIGQAGFARNRRAQGGPVDQDLPVLLVRDEKGKVIAVYTSYACHCVTLSLNKIGGDWAGYAQEAIQDAFPGAVALVSVGCGADSNPSSGVTGDKLDIATLQGREIAQEVTRLAKGYLTPVTGKLTIRENAIDLPMVSLPTRADWEAKAKRIDAIGHHARVQLEKLDRKETLPTKVSYPIQTWAFGDSLAIAFLAGEVVADYSLRLKRELDIRRLWVNGYANSAPCYIPSERVLKEGGYEGGAAMIYYDLPVPFKPGLEQPIIDVVKGQLATFPPSFDGNKTSSTRPLSPQQSQKVIRTHPNLRIDLVAAEPLLSDPVAIDFGPDGKLWVAEMIDYPQGKAGNFEPGGQIRFLEDTNGDGQFDRSAVFLDNIPFPTGVTVWRKGVLVCAAPDVLYAEDTDGDGKADVVKKLLTGFGTHNYQARVNSLQYGLDGWVYGSCGLFGGNITSFNGKIYPLGDRDFRFKPDTGELEAVSGQTQQGRGRDDAGNWFGCDNSVLIRHYPLSEHYLKRNLHVPTPEGSVFVPSGPNPNRLYPITRQQLFKLSGPPGGVTAACGLGLYRDNLIGSEYLGNSFTCEPVNLLVHRLKLKEKGSTFTGLRAANEKESEFLASTDTWFRPVQAITGPDGGLWIVDMYRFVIEHSRWIPPEDAAKLDLRAGQGMGRVYRVRPSETALRPWVRLDKLDTAGLVAALDSPNGWQRDMATQMLLWKGDKQAIPLLEPLAAKAKNELTCLHALVALDGLKGLQAKHVEKALEDGDVVVQRHAIRLAEPYLATLGEKVAAFHNSTNPQIRLQLAATLGGWEDPRAAKALANLALQGHNDPYLAVTILSSVTSKNLSGIIHELFAQSKGEVPPGKLVGSLFALTARFRDRPALQEAITALAPNKEGLFAPWQLTAAAGLLEAVEISSTPEDRQKLLPLVKAARDIAASEKPVAERNAAIQLLGRLAETRKEDLTHLSSLLSPSTPPALATTIVTRLSQVKEGEVASLLLAGWKGHTPALKSQIVTALLTRTQWQASLLEALEARRVEPMELAAISRQQLLTSEMESIRQRAAKIWNGQANPDRAKVVLEYAAIKADGNRERGKEVFTRVCSSCHRLDNVGANVGPNLAALANRNPAYLMQEIFDPNKNVDSRYIEYRAQTTAGRTVSGLLADETATTIVLRTPQGKEETLLRSDIEDLKSSSKSLMPEGLEKDLPKQDLADLLSFLAYVRPVPKAFDGNTPTIVKEAKGRMTLRAAQAEIYGDQIAFESEFQNVGMWHHSNDRVEWRFTLAKPTTFDVYLDYACETSVAGKTFLIEGGKAPLAAKAMGTGAWSKYQLVKLGQIELVANEGRLIVRPEATDMTSALLDLRTLYLVPPGEKPTPPVAIKEPQSLAEIAERILSDAVPTEHRERLIAQNRDKSADLIVLMAQGIKDLKEEYRRIPWIWRVAIAAGKRNDLAEMKSILEKSLPAPGKSLTDWQAVVIGGGLINGITQAGAWPHERVKEMIGTDKPLQARWEDTLKQSIAMADNAKVHDGTRYDALRIVALAPWEQAKPILLKYLPKGSNAELQMGSVSGLADIDHPEAVALLIEHFNGLDKGNVALAADGLIRTPKRAAALLAALEAGKIMPSALPAPTRQKLEAIKAGTK